MIYIIGYALMGIFSFGFFCFGKNDLEPDIFEFIFTLLIWPILFFGTLGCCIRDLVDKKLGGAE